jgi:hypothetical protein
VHKDKGHGFTEPVYQDALEIELDFLSIPHDAQRNSQLFHRERPLNTPTLPISSVSTRSCSS